MFVKKDFTNAGAYISKGKRCQNAKPSAYYFYMNIKISLLFISTGVTLKIYLINVSKSAVLWGYLTFSK